MATIKLGHSKSANRTLNYCDKKLSIKSALNCDIDFIKEQFTITRQLYNKNTNIQVHTVVQSFKPDEITSEVANEIGLKLASEIAPNHEVGVFTHVDTNHIHNHIVINSVNFLTGNKYNSKKSDLYRIREKSDNLCVEYGLSVIKSNDSNLRYTLAEQALLQKGLSSWKDEIRQAIDLVRVQSRDFNEFKYNLKEKYDITVDDSRKYVTYKHPEHNKVVRGKTLGAVYEKEMIVDGFTRQIAERERTITDRAVTSVEPGEQSRVRKQSTKGSLGDIKRELRNIDERVDKLTGKTTDREQQKHTTVERESISNTKKQRDTERKYSSSSWEISR